MSVHSFEQLPVRNSETRKLADPYGSIVAEEGSTRKEHSLRISFQKGISVLTAPLSSTLKFNFIILENLKMEKK